MSSHTIKLFKCDCGTEGISVSDEFIVDDKTLDFAYWDSGSKYQGNKLTFWEKIKWTIHFWRHGRPYLDMIELDLETSKNFANHILYLIGKSQVKSKEDVIKPLVEWENKKEN